MPKTIDEIRRDFPILGSKIRGKDLVYLDNGATTQKPDIVINAVSQYYQETNSNIHRGVHYLSQKATDEYEKSRKIVQHFLNAEFSEEIIFTTGTTGAINTVARAWGNKNLDQDSEVLISALEHHSNIVPWQMICEETGAKLRVIPMLNSGELNLSLLDDLITPKTKLIALNHFSNTLGVRNNIELVISKARANGSLVLIDGAQAVAHEAIDVQKLDVDFYCFSGHKLFGPTGVGIMYGKKSLLEKMDPYQGGGDMIKTVTFEKTTYNDLPHKLEAGTPNIVGGIGLGKAIEYVQSIGFEFIQQQEKNLLNYATDSLRQINGVRIYGDVENKTSVVSFNVEGLHPYDVGTILDQLGIAVRTGHHCTQPIMDFFGVPGTIRASFSFYNTKEEIDALVRGLKRAISMLK